MKNAIDGPHDFLNTLPDIERRLRVSASTVKLLVRKGKLRSVKIGRCRRIPESAFREYIQALSERKLKRFTL